MKRTTFNMSIMTPNGIEYEEVSGYAFTYKNIELVVHKDDRGYWQISEPKTGSKVGSFTARTRAGAVEELQYMGYSEEKFAGAIEGHLKAMTEKESA